MACSSLAVSMVMAVTARAAVSAALAGGNRPGWRRAAGDCWFHARQAASACRAEAGELGRRCLAQHPGGDDAQVAERVLGRGAVSARPVS